MTHKYGSTTDEEQLIRYIAQDSALTDLEKTAAAKEMKLTTPKDWSKAG